MSYIETLSEVKKWDPLFAQHSSIHEAGRFLPVCERVLPPSSGLYKPHNYVIYIYIFLLSLSLSLSSGERGRTLPCAYGLRRSFPFPFLGCFHRIAEADRLMLNPLRVGSSLLPF
ncbi:hypothetical protein BHM03_00062972 [Ensete ventricosum]|nr:hypothetical protein BHM03_00062972 [Ensete ventricosum]